MASEKKKSLRERFESFLDELDDDGPDDRGSKSGPEETMVVLRGKDALHFLGIGGDDKPKTDDKTDDGDGPPKTDDPPKRGKGYFSASDAS